MIAKLGSIFLAVADLIIINLHLFYLYLTALRCADSGSVHSTLVTRALDPRPTGWTIYPSCAFTAQ